MIAPTGRAQSLPLLLGLRQFDTALHELAAFDGERQVLTLVNRCRFAIGTMPL